MKDLRLRLFPRIPWTRTAVGGGLGLDCVHHLACMRSAGVMSLLCGRLLPRAGLGSGRRKVNEGGRRLHEACIHPYMC